MRRSGEIAVGRAPKMLSVLLLPDTNPHLCLLVRNCVCIIYLWRLRKELNIRIGLNSGKIRAGTWLRVLVPDENVGIFWAPQTTG